MFLSICNGFYATNHSKIASWIFFLPMLGALKDMYEPIASISYFLKEGFVISLSNTVYTIVIPSTSDLNFWGECGNFGHSCHQDCKVK